MTNNSKVIGFYGYKGGLGRTVSAVATATMLAEQGRRVLLIDGDLEAPGLSLSAAYSEQLLHRPGLIQLLLGELNAEDAIHDAPSVTPARFTRLPALKGSLRLLGAGTSRASSGRGIDTNALGEAMDTLSASVSFEATMDEVEARWDDLVHRLKESDDLDVVILDMRTGFSLFAGMMMRSCDVAVFLCGLNQQNILGTASFLHDLGDTAPRSVLLVSSPVPSSATAGLDESWRLINEVFEDVRPHGQPLLVGGRPRLALPYSPVLAVSDDPTKYVREHDLVSAFSDITNALRDALGIGVSDLLSTLSALMSEVATDATINKMRDLLVELARINGLQGILAREGRGWHAPSVPVSIARALDGAMDVLKALGDGFSDEVTLEVAKLWVYKLRFSTPSIDSERVLTLYERLIRRIDETGWSPHDPRGQFGRLVGRLRVDYADAILHHQRYRVRKLGEAVDPSALARAERELRGLRVELVGPGTLIWCARAISHLVRTIPEPQLMEVDAGGVTRVRSLATLAERLLAQATGAMGHKFWSDYVTVGLAVAWPRADEQEQRLRIEQAIQLTFNDERYLEYGSSAANYDRAILYLRLDDEEKAREALGVLKYDASLWRLAMGDPDLAPLHDYIAAQRPVRAQSSTHG